MEDQSVFMDKAAPPTALDLKAKLGRSLQYWQELEQFVLDQYPAGKKEWNFPGKKYGWSYRIKDKRRAILYFLPREEYFMAALVFGQKAYDQIMKEDIASTIKNDLGQARKYAEGRGIRIDVRDRTNLTDIKKLVIIKLSN